MIVFTLPAVVILIGAAQGLFLALLLLRKERNRLGNQFLAALLVAYSLSIAAIALGLARAYTAFPHLVGTTTALPFLYGPLHYLYVKYTCTDHERFQRRDAWHVVPFAAYTVYLLPFYLESAAVKRAFFLDMMAGNAPLLLDVMAGAKGLHGLLYLAAALALLYRHTHSEAPSHSDAAQRYLTWLWRLTLITAGLWVTNAVLLAAEWLGIGSFNGADLVMGLGIAAAIYLIGYLGLRQPAPVFSKWAANDIFQTPSTDIEDTEVTEKYERSGLTEEQARTYAQRLQRALEEDRIHRRNGLTLSELSDTLAISPHHLSQVINEQLDQNFFTLINSYRVEEAKRLLCDPAYDHWTILAMAEEVGFNSKSAFNVAFKRETGMTPTQFRRRARQTTS